MFILYRGNAEKKGLHGHPGLWAKRTPSLINYINILIIMNYIKVYNNKIRKRSIFSVEVNISESGP